MFCRRSEKTAVRCSNALRRVAANLALAVETVSQMKLQGVLGNLIAAWAPVSGMNHSDPYGKALILSLPWLP